MKTKQRFWWMDEVYHVWARSDQRPLADDTLSNSCKTYSWMKRQKFNEKQKWNSHEFSNHHIISYWAPRFYSISLSQWWVTGIQAVLPGDPVRYKNCPAVCCSIGTTSEEYNITITISFPDGWSKRGNMIFGYWITELEFLFIWPRPLNGFIREHPISLPTEIITSECHSKSSTQ